MKENSKLVINNYFKFKRKARDLFQSQIDKFYELQLEYKAKREEPLIGDDIFFNTNTLIHGTRLPVNELNLIKETGIIAPEFLGKYNRNKKKPFVVEFWNIEEKIYLKDYIDKYCGVTIEVKGNDGSILKQIITPISNVESEILALKNYRDYLIYQNQEQRFLPNKCINNATMAFIITINDGNRELFKNDIFSVDFDKKIIQQIIPKWFYKKYMKNRTFDNYETGREKAILYGIPSNLIEGILVNSEIENNLDELKEIKKCFPKCYICNINGKVIM